MKKLYALFALCLALAAPQVFAQAKNFEGFSLGGSLDFNKSSTHVLNTGSDSGNSAGMGLQAQYAIALNNQFVLGLGASYSLGNRKAGSLGTPATDFSSKNAMSFDISPSYAISDSLLVYGKVSSVGLTLLSTLTGVESSDMLSGIGYGLGIRSMIDKNIYIQAGYDINRYNEKATSAATFSGSSNIFSLGAGFKF